MHFLTKMFLFNILATTDGFNDNGAGIAAVLESARAMVDSDCKLL